MNNFLSTHEGHKGKVSDKWELYLSQYSQLLIPYRKKSIDLLEIGVQNGGSLEIWAKFFPKARKIIGCDINQECAKLKYKDDRISVIIGDANNDTVFEQIASEIKTPNVIIDDGSHICSEVVKSFAKYFPTLSTGGIYIVEDLHCSYWQEYGGGLFHPHSSIAFFKALVDVLNFQSWGLGVQPTKVLQDFFEEYDIELSIETLLQIHSIEFINSLCIVHKQNAEQNVLGKQSVVGIEETVVAGRLALDGSECVFPDQAQNPWQTSFVEQIETRDRRIIAYDAEIAELTQTVADREASMAELTQTVADREASMTELTQTVADREASMTELTQTVADREASMAELTQTVADREASMTELTQTVADREASMTELTQTVADREASMAELTQTVADREASMAELRNSNSWKIMTPFRLISNQIQRIYAYLRFGKALVSSFGYRGLFSRTYHVLRSEGAQGIRRRVKNIVGRYKTTGQITEHPYVVSAHNQIAPRGANTDIPNGSKVSVIVAVYKTPMDMLRYALQSVLIQGYQNWELVIVDDKSDNKEISRFLTEFAAQDSRIKYIERSENGGISAANNTALEHVTGAFYTVLDHDDALAPHALFSIAKTILSHPDVDYIYSDEDKVSKDGHIFFGPFFKPGWSPEYILAMMYTCHLSVFRTEIVQKLGGYDSAFDGAQDYDLTLRVLNKTNAVQHIPEILYHWRVWENSTAHSIDAKPLAVTRAEAALRNYLEAKQDNFVISDGPLPGHFSVDFLPKGNPLVSIVIPTANGSIEKDGGMERHIDAVCESILSWTDYKHYEIVIVHNGDIDPKQIKFFESHQNIRLSHYTSSQFNLSEKINQGANIALGEYLVIMNDDIRVISENWLTLMLGMVQRDGVGVVGPKLLFPDTTIQHAGVVLLGGLPGHAYYQEPRNAQGYALGAAVNRNYLAVTGACSITPKHLFERLGGYSLRYPLNYNDVDYCIKAHELGYRSVYLAGVEMYHYEGVSKEGGRSVAVDELERFLEDWGQAYSSDPYYNPSLSQTQPYGANT